MLAFSNCCCAIKVSGKVLGMNYKNKNKVLEMKFFIFCI